MTFLKIFLITIALIAIAWASIAVKMFVKKNGQFSKSCGSVDPKSGKNIACTCHGTSENACDNATQTGVQNT